jgi:hypothetical protein
LYFFFPKEDFPLNNCTAPVLYRADLLKEDVAAHHHNVKRGKARDLYWDKEEKSEINNKMNTVSS